MQEPWEAFDRLRYANADVGLKEIAKLIRSGCTDPTFLRLLADHVDPDVPKTPLGTKFSLDRTTGQRRPPEVPNYNLRRFLELYSDIFTCEKVEAVMAMAQKKFGVSRSTCKKELRIMRAWQERDPEAFEGRKVTAQGLRDAGDADTQPLWSDK